MRHFIAVVILTLLTVGIMYLMLHGWNSRTRKIQIANLPALPTHEEPDAPVTHGIYVASTIAGQPYERITARGLGVKAAVDVVVRADGILLLRQGADDLFIPRGLLHRVGLTGGMIGKFAAPGSIVVFRWNPGELMIDTGVHIRADSSRAVLVEQVTQLIDNSNETTSE